MTLVLAKHRRALFVQHEPIVVGVRFPTICIGSFYCISPNCCRWVGCDVPAFMSGFKQVKVGVCSGALVDPTIEIESADAIAVMSEKPVPSIGSDHAVTLSSRVTRYAEGRVSAISPISRVVRAACRPGSTVFGWACAPPFASRRSSGAAPVVPAAEAARADGRRPVLASHPASPWTSPLSRHTVLSSPMLLKSLSRLSQ